MVQNRHRAQKKTGWEIKTGDRGGVLKIWAEETERIRLIIVRDVC